MRTMRAESDSFGESLWQWLAGRQRILVLTHRRPDGDAVGSLVGAWLLLRAAGVGVDACFGDPPAPRYQEFLPPGLVSPDGLKAEDYDAVLCVDCAKRELVGWPSAAAAISALPLANIDHHLDNDRFGEVALVVPECAATSEVLVNVAKQRRLRLSPTAATALLLGLVMDTGGFRFSNTQAATLGNASWLVTAGADYPRVIDRMFFREPLPRLRLQAALVEAVQFACDGRLAYAVLTPTLRQACGADGVDTEGLIDAIRTIDGVEITCLMQPEGGDVRLSLRSRSEAYPVQPIARRLGGGGHAQAAGATVENLGMEAAVQLLLQHAGEVLSD